MPPRPEHARVAFASAKLAEPSEPEIRREHPARRAPRRSGPGALERAGRGLVALVMCALMLTTSYVLFVILGAATAQLVQGSTRLIVTAIGALALPGVGILLGATDAERGVTPTLSYRLRRAASVGMALNLGASVMLCLAMPGPILDQLRGAPNWFLPEHEEATPTSQDALPRRHRALSLRLADEIERGLGAVGIYDAIPPEEHRAPTPTRPETQQEEEPSPARPARRPTPRRQAMPAPTRPSTKAAASDDATTKDAPRRDRSGRAEQKQRAPRGSDAAPSQAPKEEDGEYVEW